MRSTRSFKWFQGVAWGAFLGGFASLLGALGDFGASWLWLASPADRLLLLVRLVSLQVPFGAWAGASLGALWCLLAPHALGTHDKRRRTLVTAALAAPPSLWIAASLWSGTGMRQLPGRPLGMAATAALGIALGTGVALGMARGLRWLGTRGGKPAALAAGAAGALGFGAGKLDQVAYPLLYPDLHGLLSVAVVVFYAVALACLAFAWPRLARGIAWYASRPLAWLPLPLLAALGTTSVWTLDHNQNVRVALSHARAGQSRSLLLALTPLLRAAAPDAATRRATRLASAARAARAQRGPARGLTILPEAHLLLITVDALRADHLGAYGYTRPISPWIDRLASESVVFEQAYAQAPHSSYSLASLMTSAYLHELVDMDARLPRATLASALAQEGFHTAAMFTRGIFHTDRRHFERYADSAFGFGLHVDGAPPAEALTDRVLREVDRTVARGEPYSLLWAHYFDAHEPYRERELGTADVDRYDGEIRNVDRAIGRLVREVRRRFRQPVVIALTADHGEEFRDHGGVYHGSTLYEEQIRVPLLLHVPGIAPRRVPDPVELVDLAPTLLGLVGVVPPEGMVGDDLRPLAQGRTWSIGPAFAGVTQRRMVVRWPHKLIADLRFDQYELYDLEHDPRERQNRADALPDRVASMRGELYAWLDDLRRTTTTRADAEHVVALDRGRLGDPRAVPVLAELLLDASVPVDTRIEAARVLAELSDPRARPQLRRAMRDPERGLAMQAAIALGRIGDASAAPVLVALLNERGTPAALRTQAALGLARLHDRRAVPALIAALAEAEGEDRAEAVRALGQLGDARAVDPLVALLDRRRLGHLAAPALGRIGDARALRPLLRVLREETHVQVRNAAVQGLGLLGDRRALPVLVRLAQAATPPEDLAETLVRLGAVEAGAVGGSDVGPGRQGRWAHCESRAPDDPWRYRQRTHCVTRGDHARVPLHVPADRFDDGAILVLGVRRADEGPTTTLDVRLNDVRLAPVAIDAHWGEQRWLLAADEISAPQMALSLTARAGTLGLDHALLIPRQPAMAAKKEQ